MPKFIVHIDADKPYEVTAHTRVDATIDAMDKHRTARRIVVKPMGAAPMRVLCGMRRVQGRDDREGGRP